MSIKKTAATVAIVTAVAVAGFVTGWFVGITGHTGVAIAAVLPVVLTGVGVALYIPFREGSLDESQAIRMSLFSIVFALSIFLGASAGNYEREVLEDRLEEMENVKAMKRIKERLLQCMWMEYKINSERESIGLHPLDYNKVCP